MRLITLLTLLFAPLMAEVQQVVLIWQPGLCQEPCTKLLAQKLGQISAIDHINIDQGAGRAYLTWKPNEAFGFQPLNAAARFVGIRVNLILLKVKGHIVQDGDIFKIISDGDGTAFNLINPVIPQVNRAAVVFNPQFRQVTPQLRDQLLQAIKDKAIVTIEGPFFEPYRSPPNILTVEKITIETPAPRVQPKPNYQH